MKSKYKSVAIKLRKRGLSYSEILEKIQVSRSSLSLWLSSIPLSSKDKARIDKKKLKSISYGRKVWSEMRIKSTEIIMKQAKREIQSINIDNNALWLMGIMLYWAEGAKEKDYKIGQGVWFSNQDPRMIKLYLLWLTKCLNIKPEELSFDIYTHITHQERAESIKRYWAKNTGHSTLKFGKIYYKKGQIKIKRHNVEKDYHGILRVRVKCSTNLNRKIMGWIDGICEKWGVVQW